VADLSLSKTASQPNGDTASGTMSFALVVVNAGPSTAANITVTDTVPAGPERLERERRGPEREQRGQRGQRHGHQPGQRAPRRP
jgi:uncharacterized repeat protein (TIGR01451 family)